MDEIDLYMQELAQEVETAFSDVPYPGDDKIVVESAQGPLTLNRIKTRFTGKNWKELLPDFISEERFSLPFLTPEAFHFFLPAYLRAALVYPEQAAMAWENTFSMLTPPEEEGSLMEYFLDRVGGFTQSQIEVIKAFVKLYITLETSYPDPQRERASSFWMQQ